MTKYKAGDVIKVIESDEGYDYALGNQYGMTGTVVRDNYSDSSGVDVKFESSAEEWYYYQSEVELVKSKRKFNVGDKVRFNKFNGGSSTYNGQEGVVTGYNVHGHVTYTVTKPAPSFQYQYMNAVGDEPRMSEADLTLVPALTPAEQILIDSGFAIGDKVKVIKGSHTGHVTTIISGSSGGTYIRADVPDNESWPFLPSEIEKFVEPVFKKGDWVRVEDYSPGSPVFEGWEGEVTDVASNGSYPCTTVKFTGYKYNEGTFPSKFVVPAERPEPTFEVGDWVEVRGYNTSGDSVWEGRKGIVDYISYHGTVAVDFTPSNDGGYTDGGFSPKHLIACEDATPAPEPEQHWTVSAPVGATAQLHYKSDDTINRVIVKKDAEHWLHLYQNSSDGTVRSTRVYDIEDTQTLVGHYEPVFV